MSFFDGFGKGGGGAPLRDSNGNPIANLKMVLNGSKAAANLSPSSTPNKHFERSPASNYEYNEQSLNQGREMQYRDQLRKQIEDNEHRKRVNQRQIDEEKRLELIDYFESQHMQVPDHILEKVKHVSNDTSPIQTPRVHEQRAYEPRQTASTIPVDMRNDDLLIMCQRMQREQHELRDLVDRQTGLIQQLLVAKSRDGAPSKQARSSTSAQPKSGRREEVRKPSVKDSRSRPLVDQREAKQTKQSIGFGSRVSVKSKPQTSVPSRNQQKDEDLSHPSLSASRRYSSTNRDQLDQLLESAKVVRMSYNNNNRSRFDDDNLG